MSSDPNQEQDPQQQEQMREYVEQLRSAEPAEIVAQAFTMLGTGAEVKLGQPDARVLIDAIDGLVTGVEGNVPQQLLDGMRSGVSQLQQAQVQAEAQAGGGAAPQPQHPPAGSPQPSPGGPAGGQGGPAGGQQGEDQSMTDRLWVPGRDQPPPAR